MPSLQQSLLFAAALSTSNVLAAYISAVPAPRVNSCGAKGYTTNTDAYFYDESGRYAGYAKCYAKCQTDSDCQSFGYDAKKTCMLYNVAVYGNFEDDDDSPYTFYNRGCTTGPSSTTTAAITVKTTTTPTPTPATTTTTTTPAKSTTKSVSLPVTLSTTKAAITTSSTKAATSNTIKTSTTLSIKAPTTSSVTSSKPSTTTTTTTTKSTSPSPSSTAVTIPSGCPIPNQYTVTDFYWYNSTHNLDCARGPDVGDGTGCLDDTGNWCDPHTVANCTHCGIPMCMTGLPEQGVGYGPPDDLRFTFSDGTTCRQYNSGQIRRMEDGEGWVNCGGLWDFLNFYGSSNSASSVGRAEVNSYPMQCADGDTITGYYTASFTINCVHDAGFNATCTTPRAFNLPLAGFTKTKSY